MIPKVEKSLGTKYPDDPEKLVEHQKKVAGPLMTELRQRYNELGPRLAAQLEENEAAILLVDTTGMKKGTTMTNGETGDVYAFDPAGVPGVGDLAALPTGAWFYSFTL